jgi:hypothetical protein
MKTPIGIAGFSVRIRTEYLLDTSLERLRLGHPTWHGDNIKIRRKQVVRVRAGLTWPRFGSSEQGTVFSRSVKAGNSFDQLSNYEIFKKYSFHWSQITNRRIIPPSDVV